MGAASNDLFLSYRWADKAIVEPLLAALRGRGVRVWQDAREVDDLSSIQRAVADGLGQARALLAWYSSGYNESRACQWELTAAYCAAQAESDPRTRILVVNPEPGNAHVHLPELFDQLHFSAQGVPDDPSAVEVLADRIDAALRNTVPATPLGEISALTPPRWLPSMGMSSTRFVGRLREMWQLHGQLLAGQAAMLTGTGGKPGLALVRGAGGIGKSLMAEEYALRFGAAWPGGVFWIRAYGHPDGGTPIAPQERANRRDAQLLDLAVGMGIDISGLEPAAVRAAMARRFAHDARPFLWVVDDLPSDLGVDELKDWLAPHALGHTLITSRTRRFTSVPTVDLPQLDRAEACGLLTRHRELTAAEAAVADEICAALGDHALAVDVTAALVERRGLDATRQALDRTDKDVLDLAAQFQEALPNGHQRHIAATFIESIRQLDEPSRDLLRLAAVLAAAPIPRLLLVRGVAAAAVLDENDAQDRTDLATDRLLSSSLADNAGDGAISVHTLVSRTVRFAEAASGALAAWREYAVGVLGDEMTQAADIRRHVHLEPWVEHARELSADGDERATLDLLGRVARYDFERAAYTLARGAAERQAEICKRVLGEEHPATLSSIGNLANTLHSQGDLPGARRLEERVLDVRRRVLGGEHPDTLTAANNLARTLADQGDLAGARRLQETVVEICERTMGEEHPDRLGSMSNLARSLADQGDLKGATQLDEAVLEVRERVLGLQHPDTLVSMNNLASSLWRSGDFQRARQLQEAVLAVNKRMLGEEHPNTLTSMSNLAATRSSQGDHQGAIQLQETVLETSRRVFGDEHPDTLTAKSNLSITLTDRGDLPGARRLQEAVLAVRKRMLGEQHPDTLTAMSNLASSLADQGDLSGAGRLQTAVLDVRRRVLGEEHPDTLTAMSNLASTLADQGDLPGARRLEEAALKCRQSVLGGEHPDTLMSMNNLAATLQLQGDLPGARRLHDAVLKVRKRVLGEWHLSTLTSVGNLAMTLWEQGDTRSARRMQQDYVQGLTRVLGPTHPRTLQAEANLNRLCSPLDQPPG